MTEPPLKTALRRHLAEHGLRTDQTVREVNAQLRELLGRRRYAALCAATDRYDAGAAGIEEMYQSVQTVAAANALMSLQGSVILEAGWHLADHCLRDAPRDGGVLELGCWTGTLAAFIADHRPDLQVAGTDRLGHLIEAASRHHRRRPNLSFVHWDYSTSVDPQLGKFDTLISSFGLDFNQTVQRDYGFGPTSCRASQGHSFSYREARPHFSNWRTVADTGAVLAVVLRVGCAGHAVAVLDAAADAGWSVQLNRSHRFQGGDEMFPLLVFAAGGENVRQVDETTLMRWWEAAS